jgi:hypothetical protein
VQELLLLAVEAGVRRDVEAEQARERQVDLLDLAQVEGIAQPAQSHDLVGREDGLRRAGQLRPRRTLELDVGGDLPAGGAPVGAPGGAARRRRDLGHGCDCGTAAGGGGAAACR